MQYRALTVLVIVAVMVSSSAISLLAQDIKIGYIDSIKIFAEYEETREAERIYKREVDQCLKT